MSNLDKHNDLKWLSDSPFHRVLQHGIRSHPSLLETVSHLSIGTVVLAHVFPHLHSHANARTSSLHSSHQHSHRERACWRQARNSELLHCDCFSQVDYTPSKCSVKFQDVLNTGYESLIYLRFGWPIKTKNWNRKYKHNTNKSFKFALIPCCSSL